MNYRFESWDVDLGLNKTSLLKLEQFIQSIILTCE